MDFAGMVKKAPTLSGCRVHGLFDPRWCLHAQAYPQIVWINKNMLYIRSLRPKRQFSDNSDAQAPTGSAGVPRPARASGPDGQRRQPDR
jgi:hypothetical protein